MNVRGGGVHSLSNPLPTYYTFSTFNNQSILDKLVLPSAGAGDPASLLYFIIQATRSKISALFGVDSI